MKNLKFIVTYGRTVNLGNYNSEKLTLSMEYDKDLHDIEEAFEEVRQKVMQELGVKL